MEYDNFKNIVTKRFDYIHPTTQLRNLTTCIQDQKEHPGDFASRLQQLADKYFTEVFKDAASRVVARQLYKAQLLAQFLTGLRDPVGRLVMSRDPQTFEEAIDIAVQETENEHLREQKGILLRGLDTDDGINTLASDGILQISTVRNNC